MRFFEYTIPNDFKSVSQKEIFIQMNRKTLLLASLFMTVLAFSPFAQGVELTPFGGYTFRSTINITGGQAKVLDGFTYGGALTLDANSHTAIELSYYRYETTATAQSIILALLKFQRP
jgi:hypothetical protein